MRATCILGVGLRILLSTGASPHEVISIAMSESSPKFACICTKLVHRALGSDDIPRSQEGSCHAIRRIVHSAIESEDEAATVRVLIRTGAPVLMDSM